MGALQGYSLEKISNPWTILDMTFVDDIVIQWHQKFLGIQPSNDYSNLSVKRNGQTDYYIHQIEEWVSLISVHLVVLSSWKLAPSIRIAVNFLFSVLKIELQIKENSQWHFQQAAQSDVPMLFTTFMVKNKLRSNNQVKVLFQTIPENW